ncbi:hypothetical protein [Niastella sp. OAS944]|uniref:hypothetical protein n=1 Tax=Niastella sp. OAS944 TaxID=2664089 RepID=UPI0034838D6B|nr:hypothetical protein [Chitinophagaceae bacterium OAS944]
MKLSEHFKILAESQVYILGNEFEYGYIINKKIYSKIYLGSSCGDPTLGIIDQKEQWALLLGHTSYLWTPIETFKLSEIHSTCEEIFEWPYSAKQINDFEVEILEDPWSDNPGIYIINVKEKSVKRIRDFKKLEVPFDDKLNIEW